MIAGVGSRIASPDLIGRERELEGIASALHLAAAGEARTLLIGGEAGIGKSRVLTAALDAARAEGAATLVGGCIGLAEGSLPFAPIVEALRPLVRDLQPDGLDAAREGSRGGRTELEPDEAARRASLLGVAAELGLLADRRSQASTGAELRPEWARSRLYEAFLELLRRLAADRPVVLAIEDLHWADDSTRELLAFLVRNARNERLLLLITFRSDELTRRHPLLFWLAETDRSPGVERLELRRLGQTAVARQLAGILGHPPDTGLVASVYERSDGNPFFAEELLAAGAETRRLPPTLREVLAARLAHVSERTLRLLGVAAVVGRQVDHDLLAELAGLSEPDLLDALEEAVAAQLLVVDESVPIERYAFRHALIGEAAAEAILPSQRRRLHVVIAEALERAPRLRGAEEAGHLAEIAHHWFEGRELGRALVASVRAAEAASAASAFVEALRQYDRVLELWDVVPDPEEATGIRRIELLRRTALAAQLAGEFGRAAAVLREGLELLDAVGDDVRAGLFLERLGRALWTAGQFNASLEAYRAAVQRVPASPPSPDRARVLAGLAQVLMLGGRNRESLPIAEEAMTLARATGERQIEGHAMTTLGIDVSYVSDGQRGVELVRQALAIAEEVEDWDDVGRGYACLSSTLDLTGRAEEAVEVALEGVARLRKLGMGATYGAFVQMNAAESLISLGRWDEAVRLAEHGEPVARGNARTTANIQLARVYLGLGRLAAARRAMETAAESLSYGPDAQFNGPLSVVRIDLALLEGGIDQARAAADESLPILEATEDEGALAMLLSRALRVEAEAIERARAARDEAAIAEATARADGFATRLRAFDLEALPAGYGDLVRLAVGFGEAEATRIAGRSDPEAWAAAAALAEARPVVAEVGYARYREAEAVLADRGDRERAASTLRAARGIAVRLGARPLLVAIDGLAARARLTLPADDAVAVALPSPAPGPAAGYDLTPREVEVLRLVAAGRTNRQIGEELFISESTAGVHVSRILAKFGVAGRVEAATIAARLGIAE
jgi:DNA-binding NarL/FixJ family response regulator